MRELTDAQWAILQPLLPPRSRTGRPRADDRRTLNADLYVLRTGCAWRDLPEKYGDDSTAHRRLQHWQTEGVWERIHHALLGMCWSAASASTGLLACSTAVSSR